MTFNIYLVHVYHSDGFTESNIPELRKFRELLESYFEPSTLKEADDGKISINKEDPWTVDIKFDVNTEQAQKLVGLVFLKNNKIESFLSENRWRTESVEMYD